MVAIQINLKMRKSIYTTILLALSLLSFGQNNEQEQIDHLPADTNKIEGEASAVLYFLNDCIAQQKVLYFHNDKYIGMLKGKQSLKYDCPSGEQLFWINDNGKVWFVPADLNPGEKYFVLVDIDLPKSSVGLSITEVLIQDHTTYFDIKPITETNDLYKLYKERLLNKKRIIPSQDKIDKMNKRLYKSILKNLEKYETNLKFKYKYSHISPEMSVTDPEIK